ncbi:MAG: 5-formyltetrahydrofolate cyclo-ligase [Firmicutes bacterium]|nr:5-formyltetrahydrofolate cyclo-ligase [Bacillota bacterium]
MTTKKELRSQMLKARRAMDPARVRKLSERICRNVRTTELYQRATSLCVYMPINNEAEADLLIGPAQADGKKVFIPKVVGEEMIFNAYDPVLIREEGPFHIRESASEEVLEPDVGTLIIMPGSVFDVRGHRIGYGGGYYDKYLARCPQCMTIAVCFDFQIVDDLPAEAHDICPQLIVSEDRIIGG